MNVQALIGDGFFPKITLPTRISERSSSLIDNIFTNDSEEKETAGILLNHLSDHQIIFTYIEKLSYIEKLPKFITIEKNNAASVQNFIREMDALNICDELNQSIDGNPEENYEVFLKLIKDVKDKCLPKKVVKYNKKKHKKSKWIKTDVNDLNLFSRRKDEFKSYYNTLRRSIKEAKRLYYTRTFAIYKNDIKKLGLLSKIRYTEKQNVNFPINFS